MANSQTITVSGMTCGHCVSAVKAEVGKIDGVTEVDVELESGQVTIASEHEVGLEALRAAVDEAGYEVVA